MRRKAVELWILDSKGSWTYCSYVYCIKPAENQANKSVHIPTQITEWVIKNKLKIGEDPKWGHVEVSGWVERGDGLRVIKMPCVGGWRGGSAVSRACCPFREPAFNSSTHSSSEENSALFWPLWAPTHTWHVLIQTHINKNKIKTNL